MISLDASIYLIDSEEAAEYEDTSAAYWELYISEAGIKDAGIVDTLKVDAASMGIVVRPSISPV